MTKFAILLSAFLSTAAAAAPGVTFYKDVLPVLQNRCQECHRSGEAAPMKFFTYEETRPWAKAIKSAVVSGKMPPWFADPHTGKFSNARTLTDGERSALLRWAETGAQAGDPKDAPPARTFAEGWAIGKPDVVIELPEPYEVAANGTIDYTYFIVPTGFTEDKWIQMAEARPDKRDVEHHIIAFVREPGSKWFREYPAGKGFVPKKGGEGEASEFLSGYAPGAQPQGLRPGEAKLIKAGSDIVFQMHYTANGKVTQDRSRLGIVFAKEPPTRRVLTLGAQNRKFVIPAGDSNYRVDGSLTLQEETELLSLVPHMHVRGKAFEMRAVYPTGESEVLLKVPRYDFNWQLWYVLSESKKLPKGTKIEATGWFDNSVNNKSNPDPNSEVRWGDQSWEEMMIGFFNVSMDVKVNPIDVLRPKKPMEATTGSGGQ